MTTYVRLVQECVTFIYSSLRYQMKSFFFEIQIYLTVSPSLLCSGRSPSSQDFEGYLSHCLIETDTHPTPAPQSRFIWASGSGGFSLAGTARQRGLLRGKMLSLWQPGSREKRPALEGRPVLQIMSPLWFPMVSQLSAQDPVTCQIHASAHY